MGKYEDIPVGEENAITREELARKWRCSDRKARLIIATLRAEDNGDNLIIVSRSAKAGYYRTDDIETIKRFRDEQGKRARRHFLPFKKVNRVLREKRTTDEAHLRR